MKRVIPALAAAVFFGGLVFQASTALAENKVEERDPGETWFVYVDALPTNLDEFRALRDQLATTPQGGMVPFLVAGIVLGTDRNLGEQMMVLSVDPELLSETYKALKNAQRINVDGWQLGGRILAMFNSASFQRGIDYAGKAYVEGATTENGYQLPAPPYKFIVRKHRVQGNDPKIWHAFANCSGATGPRPFEVKEIEPGKWRMMNTSSFFAGTAPPPAQGAPRGPR